MSHFPGFDLTGKVILVTGAGRGIGKAIALCAAEQGADLALGSRTGPELEAVAEEIRNCGRQVTVGPLDVTDLDSIQEFVENTWAQMGRLDVLVNNAGYNKLCPALEVTEELWDEIVDTNLKGLFFMSQTVARYWIEQGKKGKIINITSQVGLVGGPLRSPYCGAKGGVVNMTRALACEWAPQGITVNAVAPTFTRTPLAEKALQNPDFKSDVLSRILLGRLAEPEEIAGAVLFLASEAANMVTGHTLAVDGGWTAV